MTAIDLFHHLMRFLRGRQAYALCHPYHIEPTEALGELFLRLLRRIDQPIQKPQAWVAANARGYLQHFLRRECRSVHAEAVERGIVEMEIERKEIRQVLERELAALPDRERDALTGLAGVDGVSCRTVARRYGVSPETARNWAAAARKKLAPRLEGLL